MAMLMPIWCLSSKRASISQDMLTDPHQTPLDAEGQLTNASYQALTPETNPTSPLRGDNFTYDALGNRGRRMGSRLNI
jgi:hypothetical protein